MAIFGCFVLLCIFATVVSSCNYKVEKVHLEDCLDQWSYHRVYKDDYSRFLRDDSVTSEICARGSIQRVEECVKATLSPHCGPLHRYWQGTRNKFRYICKRYNEYSSVYKECRTNEMLSPKLDKCVNENIARIHRRESFCESSNQLKRCLAEAFIVHCSRKATEFFMHAYDAELGPQMTHLKCPQDTIILLQPETEPPMAVPCLLDVNNPNGCGHEANYEAISNSSPHAMNNKNYMPISFSVISVLNILFLTKF